MITCINFTDKKLKTQEGVLTHPLPHVWEAAKILLLHLLLSAFLAGILIMYSPVYQYLGIIPEAFFPSFTLFLNPWDSVAVLLTWVFIHPVFQTGALTTAYKFHDYLPVSSASRLPSSSLARPDQ